MEEKALIALVCEFGLNRPALLRLQCSDISLISSGELRIHTKKGFITSKNYSAFFPVLQFCRFLLRTKGKPQSHLFTCSPLTLNNRFKRIFGKTIKQYHDCKSTKV